MCAPYPAVDAAIFPIRPEKPVGYSFSNMLERASVAEWYFEFLLEQSTTCLTLVYSTILVKVKSQPQTMYF